MSEPRPTRHVFSKRTRTAFRILGTAAALALVIIVIGALSYRPSAPSSPPSVTTATPGPGSALYQEALAALASGDTTQATLLLRRAADAGSADAKRKLEQLAPPASTPATTPAAPSGYTSAVADMGSLLPVSVPGYRLGVPETSTASALVPASPPKSGSAIAVIVFEVFDKQTPAAASSFVTKFAKGYPRVRSSVPLGAATALFGTDGSHVAALTFSRGRFAFDVVVTVNTGDPAAVKAQAIAAAKAFPAAGP